jgi:hypothetical protein
MIHHLEIVVVSPSENPLTWSQAPICLVRGVCTHHRTTANGDIHKDSCFDNSNISIHCLMILTLSPYRFTQNNATTGAPVSSYAFQESNEIRESQPNTALFCLILALGTFFIAYYLRRFRNSKFLGRSVSITQWISYYNRIHTFMDVPIFYWYTFCLLSFWPFFWLCHLGTTVVIHHKSTCQHAREPTQIGQSDLPRHVYVDRFSVQVYLLSSSSTTGYVHWIPWPVATSEERDTDFSPQSWQVKLQQQWLLHCQWR